MPGGVFSSTALISMALNAIILIFLLSFSKESLRKIRHVLDILEHGSFKNCPYCIEKRKNGRRWYDNSSDEEILSKIHSKGGQKL